MKKRFLASVLALTMLVSLVMPNMAYARYSNSETYNYESTDDLKISMDGEEIVLTWPVVDKSGNVINANHLVASNGQGKDPMGSWTIPHQGMIIDYTSAGWTIDGSNTSKISLTEEQKYSGDFPVIMGLNDNSPEKKYVINKAYYEGTTQMLSENNTYIDNTVVAQNYAPAYVIEYSKDGENWITDGTAVVPSHGKKLMRMLSDGTFKEDTFNSFFLVDQFVELLSHPETLEPETEYKFRVSAYDALVKGNGTEADTSKAPYKVFETTYTTPKASFKQIAFPSVEGGGINTQGGRGGDVYVVTNLTDSITDPQPGSLRYGLERMDRADKDKTYPRTIVFAVGGTIHVDPTAGKSQRRLNIGDNTTIAGQTAPGDGITIAGMSGKFGGENIIVRYVNFMLGDGYDIDGATASGKNIVIDHCTFMMGIDETFTAKELVNSSIQYNIIADALYIPNKNGKNNTDNELASNEGEAKHGMGSIWNGYDTTFTHNFFTSNGNRSPRFEGAFTYGGKNYANKMTFANNVVYNWGHNSSYGGDRGEAQVNFVGNYYKPGPSTLEKVKGVFFDCDTDSSYGGVKSSYYIEGNVMEGNDELTSNNDKGFLDLSSCANKLDKPVELTNGYTAESAKDAYNKVVAHVGASHNRNAYVARLIDDLENNTGRMVNTEAEISGYDDTEVKSDVKDTDMDGMPDQWETEQGLDPNSNADAGVIVQDENSPYYGYSNIEIYLNTLTGEWDSTVTRDNVANPTLTLDVEDFTALKQENKTVSYTAKSESDSALSQPVFYLNDIKVNAAVTADENGTSGTAVLDLTNIPYGEYYLQAKTTDSENGLSVLSKMIPVTVVPEEANLEGFTLADVGSVKIPGQTYLDGKSLIMTGSGSIGYSASTGSFPEDSFTFNYIKASGDISISAKLDDWSKIDTYQKAGVMIRKSLDPKSEFYMSALTYLKGEDYPDVKDVNGSFIGSKDIAFFGRTSDGGGVIPYAKSSNFKAMRIPITREGEPAVETWVKVEKKGQKISTYASTDGKDWKEIRSFDTNGLDDEFYIGFAVEAMQDKYDGERYHRVEFSNISFGNDTGTVMYGDADNNGSLESSDAASILQKVLKSTYKMAVENATAYWMKYMDVTADGQLNSADAATVLQKVLKSTYKMPVEG